MQTSSPLETYRKGLGLTQGQTAIALGLSASSVSWISEIENGRRDASPRLALRIEHWSGGAVKAADVCGELRFDHVTPGLTGGASEAAAPAPVSLEKSGVAQ
jgi:transcriptional regulator with XRE-family HTH domain